jgi:transcriptional regulator with XRE-family HTH domain
MLTAMTTRTKKLAATLTAGVTLSSGAYALGSQAGDGGAVAAGTKTASTATGGSSAANVSSGVRRDRGPGGARGLGRRGDFGLSALADRLGVTTTALRDALQAIRTSKTPEQRRAELVQALATALGRPAADVQTAVDSALPARGDRKAGLAAAIAKELGVETAKVQAGLDRLRADRGTRRDRDGKRGDRRRGDRGQALVDAIAASTGVDAAKVRAALDKLGPDRGDRRDRRDDLRQRLATALKVTPDQLGTALDKVRTDQRNAFATALAQRLNIDVQKVQAALQDLPRGGRRHG